MTKSLAFTKKVKRWGSSLIIRLSPDEVEALGLKQDEFVEGVISKFVEDESSSAEELLTIGDKDE